MYGVRNDFFTYLLGISIRRECRFYGSRFIYGQGIGLAVDGTRRRKNKCFYTVFGHKVEQVEHRYQIITIIEQRFLYRFSYRFTGCKIDNAFNAAVFFEELAHGLFVLHIDLLKSRACTRDAFDTIDDFGIGVGQIVEYDDFIPCIL